jgi:hypothetical protein
MRPGIVLVAAVIAFAAASRPVGARPADTKGWCAAVIQTNTKYGTMKHKQFLPPGQVPLSSWKKVIDATLARQSQYIAIAPAPLKTAIKHQVAWFARVKANHYSLKTPLAPMTVADARKISAFEKAKCGITFAT